MQTTLLGIVRSETERRNAPAVLALQAAEAQEQAGSRQLLKWYRAVRHGLGEPLRLASMIRAIISLHNGEIILWSRGHKSDEVAQALQKAGLSAERITYLEPVRRKALRQGRFTFILQATYWLLLRSGMYLQLTARTRPFLDSIVTYIALKSSLERIDARYWVVIGDLSPSLIALCGAAREAGHATIGWQTDYLDFKHFPVRPDFAAVLNETGVRLARRGGSAAGSTNTYWREAPAICPLRLDLDDGGIGVLLNAFADEATIERLARLQQRLQKVMEVRLHPRSCLDIQSMPAGLEAAPRSETLDQFVNRNSLVICGNTSAQLKALCLGTPVVQLAGLDHLDFDHHGYIARGLAIGFERDEELSMERVAQFYQKEFRASALRRLVGPEPEDRKPPLTAMVKRLNETYSRPMGAGFAEQGSLS